MASIELLHIYKYPARGDLWCGLQVMADAHLFPLVVGCSLRAPSGKIIDVPARQLVRPGRALWKLPTPGYADFYEWRSSNPARAVEVFIGGEIIFALWRDASFSSRLADTGWQSWDPQDPGPKSEAYLKSNEIEALYGNWRVRDKVWNDL